MKKVFAASLIKNGVLGGGICLDGSGMRYHTGKIVSEDLKDIALFWNDMETITVKGIVFKISMHDGSCFRFLIFRKKAFIRTAVLLSEKKDLFPDVII